MSFSASSSPRSSITDSLQQIKLDEHYDILHQLGTGTFGTVLLGACKETGKEVALKLCPKSAVSLTDFQREFTYSYYLSPHYAIINTFDCVFETSDDYIFVQEYAHLGDLFEAIPQKTGLPDVIVKYVLRQLVSALEFMHSKALVHRDIKPENVLVFAKDCSKIKLTDFGLTRKAGGMVKKTRTCSPYTPPEVCETLRNERYCVETSLDVWATGVLIFCAITGHFPWQHAEQMDHYYLEFSMWQKRKVVKVPSQWQVFGHRLMKLFRRIFEANPDKRCAIREIYKYLDHSWIHHSKSESLDDQDCVIDENRENMEELSAMLKTCGVNTKLTRRFREKRIEDWLKSAVDVEI